MATLTTEETVAFVEKLIAAGKGDPGRLQHILSTLQKARNLYISDQKYLETKLAQEIGLQQKPKKEDPLLTKVQNLIMQGSGDIGRLQFILESLSQGKPLYHSDQKYLEGKLGEKIIHQDIIKSQLDSNKTIETLKAQVVAANQKIESLESILSNKVTLLKKTQEENTKKVVTLTRGAMPKGWHAPSAAEELGKIQQEINIEQVKLNEEKNEAERLRIEQSKLMQIILDRKEFERQVQIEQEKLENQIQLERQNILQQTKIVEQIKKQEAELEEAKNQRDVVSRQLQEEQARLSASVLAQKASLTEVKNEYEKVTTEIRQQEQEIVRQVEQEKIQLAQQIQAAKKIEEEKLQLENIRQEHQKIVEQTKFKEGELTEQLVIEKKKLEQQETLLKAISKYEKSLNLLKQRQKLLTTKIGEQKEKLRQTSPLILQIDDERVILDKMTAESIEMKKQIDFAKLQLKEIKKERAKIEKELKRQESTLSRTKKREIHNLEQLKRKRRQLVNEIQVEETEIKKLKDTD